MTARLLVIVLRAEAFALECLRMLQKPRATAHNYAPCDLHGRPALPMADQYICQDLPLFVCISLCLTLFSHYVGIFCCINLHCPAFLHICQYLPVFNFPVFLCTYLHSLHLPILICISWYLPIFAHISLCLPIFACVCLHLSMSTYLCCISLYFVVLVNIISPHFLVLTSISLVFRKICKYFSQFP